MELAVQYGQTTNIVTATRQNDVDSWEAAVSVPTSTPFTISITWYDMVDPQRLDLVTSTRRFDAITTSGEFSLEVEFDNYDSEAFDADGDSASNLREREDGTLPFDASSPGTQDDDGTADASSPVEQNTVSSRFDSDSEGWVITGDAQGNESTPTFEPQIGDASAHIIANDNQSGGTWYFSAPDKFLGNINNFYGGNVNFELKTSTSSNVFVERDVILTSGDLAISVQLPSVPESEFTTFTVPLIETGWVDSSEEPVDTNMFTFILTNLDSLQIRGEYNVGPDIGGLDNVVLSMIAP